MSHLKLTTKQICAAGIPLNAAIATRISLPLHITREELYVACDCDFKFYHSDWENRTAVPK